VETEGSAEILHSDDFIRRIHKNPNLFHFEPSSAYLVKSGCLFFLRTP
jgi:hypothetical protein